MNGKCYLITKQNYYMSCSSMQHYRSQKYNNGGKLLCLYSKLFNCLFLFLRMWMLHTLHTWVTSHVTNMSELCAHSMMHAKSENIVLWHHCHNPSPLHCLQLILSKKITSSLCFSQGLLLAVNLGGAIGSCRLLICKDTKAGLSTNGTWSHVFPWLHNNSCGWRCVDDWSCSLQACHP